MKPRQQGQKHFCVSRSVGSHVHMQEYISALLWAAIYMGIQLKTATDAGILWGESRSPYKPTLPSAAATMRAVCALIPGLQEVHLPLLDI